ncbi:MAG: hypothetical protein KAS83_02105 [Dehalococcoidia bacterium]|jgi:hypothetical protein|nr:hypothetical protein [Dehalococcoidia bacterium]
MHPLDGPRAKVKRAKAQLIALQKDSERFFTQNPNIIAATEFDKKAGNYPIIVKRCPSELPEQWSVIVGEITHNLRSALDLLAWQLALLETPTPSSYTAFPIFYIGRSGRKGTNSFWGEKGKGPRCLKSIHRRYWVRIEAFQPYKGGHGYLRSPLFLLRELNNTDKHRLIPILFASVSSSQITGFFGGGSKIKIGVPIRPNAKIGWINPLPFAVPVLHGDGARFRIKMQEETQVKFNISSSVRFGDGCYAVRNLPIFRTLDNINKEVSRIIESFASDF